MDANSWLWVAIIGFLVFCCLPMLFMGRRDRRSRDDQRGDDDVPSAGRRE